MDTYNLLLESLLIYKSFLSRTANITFSPPLLSRTSFLIIKQYLHNVLPEVVKCDIQEIVCPVGSRVSFGS